MLKIQSEGLFQLAKIIKTKYELIMKIFFNFKTE